MFLFKLSRSLNFMNNCLCGYIRDIELVSLLDNSFKILHEEVKDKQPLEEITSNSSEDRNEIL
jgi:hypothetical protein